MYDDTFFSGEMRVYDGLLHSFNQLLVSFESRPHAAFSWSACGAASVLSAVPTANLARHCTLQHTQSLHTVRGSGRGLTGEWMEGCEGVEDL